jgi:hypothetical protein
VNKLQLANCPEKALYVEPLLVSQLLLLTCSKYGGAKEDAFLVGLAVPVGAPLGPLHPEQNLLCASRYRLSYSLRFTSSSSKSYDRLEQQVVLSEVRLLPTLEGVRNVA